MKLSQLLKEIDYLKVEGRKDLEVKAVSCDSRFLLSPSLFLIKSGRNFSGLDFVAEAKGKCCAFMAEEKDAALLWEKIGREKKTLIIVPDIGKAYFDLAHYLLKKSKDVKTIGITGTNGKTTVAYLLWHILKACGKKPSLSGTIDYRWGAKRIRSFLTTPDLLTFANLLWQTKLQGGEYMVAEVSSHALAQERLAGLKLFGAVFTNLTQDHLDYHKDMDAYFQAKLKIFDFLSPSGFAALNNDDAFCRRAYQKLNKDKFSFGLGPDSDIRARAWRLNKKGLEAIISEKANSYFLASRLKGEFNLYNILAAWGCARRLKIKPEKIIEAVKSFSAPLGRLEEVKPGVFVDYAHTPDALEKALVCLRKELEFEKIALVFGCGGERDKEKRPLMGKIAASWSDYCLITNDNPRREDPAQIARQIAQGAGRKKCRMEIILERKKAIAKALRFKQKSRNQSFAVLVAGKGHEDYQVFRNKKIPFSDRQAIEAFYQELEGRRYG